MDVEAFEATVKEPRSVAPPVEAEIVDADEADDEIEQAYEDMIYGIQLMESVKRMLDYLADPRLTKAISKRERNSMLKLSEEVKEFLATMYPTYMEVV